MFDTDNNVASKYFVNHKKYFVTYRNKTNSIKGGFIALGINLEEAQEVAAMSIQMKCISENTEQFEIELQEITGSIFEEIILQISLLFRF